VFCLLFILLPEPSSLLSFPSFWLGCLLMYLSSIRVYATLPGIKLYWPWRFAVVVVNSGRMGQSPVISWLNPIFYCVHVMIYLQLVQVALILTLAVLYLLLFLLLFVFSVSYSLSWMQFSQSPCLCWLWFVFVYNYAIEWV
jgi:hypothetical protein